MYYYIMCLHSFITLLIKQPNNFYYIDTLCQAIHLYVQYSPYDKITLNTDFPSIIATLCY